jgi:Xaa-Pro aminopeptidase
LDNSLSTTLFQRRKKLAEAIANPVILWSGRAPCRNFPANRFPFRASSHFLYFAGLSLDNVVIKLDRGKLELFMDNASADDELWHGKTPTREEIAIEIGADAVYPLSELSSKTKDAATIAVQDLATYQQQCQLLNRNIAPAHKSEGIDLELAKAIVNLRLIHDRAALAEIKKAAAVSIEAHLAGMQAVSEAKYEAEVRSAMEGVIIANNMTCAYGSIVTVHGEVLHNETYDRPMESGDLLLADVGAETNLGWASDITRTFPVSGKFSSTQKDIYDIVLAAQTSCIEKIRPGIEYREIHLRACEVIAEALFFPHGIGHLLGLDVHDMEDLGDLAGYEEGRQRSDRFGLGYLRLDRSLQPGMVVTIEPGFYQVPAILNNPQFLTKYRDVVNWERLDRFADVRGIRIEDDVLVTESGSEVLTAELIK